MFGMGAGELIVIAIVALLFLGPEKLPEAAKTLSKGIRDFRKQTRELQKTIEEDNEIGGALRDLKSALRGEEPRPSPQPPKTVTASASAGAITAGGKPAGAASSAGAGTSAAASPASPAGEPNAARDTAEAGATGQAADSDIPVIRPAAGTVATFVLGRGPSVPQPATAVTGLVSGRDAATPEPASGEAPAGERAASGEPESDPDKANG